VGSKGGNAQSLAQISAIFSANSSPAPTGAQSSGKGVTGDQDMDDAWDEGDGEEPTWEDVIPTRGRERNSKLKNTSPLTSIPKTKFNVGGITGRGLIHQAELKWE